MPRVRLSFPTLRRFGSAPGPADAGPRTSDVVEREQDRFYFASQWQLIWWRFRRHKLALVATAGLVLLYVLAAFCEFWAPYTTTTHFPQHLQAPPSKVHWISQDGKFGPYVSRRVGSIDQETYRRVYVEDRTTEHRVRFFVRGERYKLWGLFPAHWHLFGVEGDGQILLFGSDRLGRDLFSRVLYGARISLTIGLVGVFLSFVLGLSIGGISGYFGGMVDGAIQRTIDLMVSIPTIPLWMALAASLPRTWSIVQTYLAITVVLSVVAWAGLARVVRGKLLALREEDFATAAKVAGASEWRTITVHLLPLFLSYIVVSMTLAIPGMILGETALSFLGLGMQPPGVSWGVLLQDAQQVVSIAHQPWILIPSVFVVVTVLLFNFLGDGLRDAADPYAN